MNGVDSADSERPSKLLSITTFVFKLCTKVPYDAAKYVVPQLRPYSSWPYKTAFMSTFAELVFEFLSKIRAGTPSLSPTNDGFTTVEPGLADIYRKPLLHENIKPVKLNGLWMPKAPELDSANKAWVILHFHGGGYVLNSPAQGAFQDGMKKFLHESRASCAFAPAYRLASKPGCTFPAQLQDAVTSYNYLLDQNISPSQILLSGDSSGAHLALSLLRYLEDNPVLPKPRALLLHSPWLNLTKEGCTVERSSKRHTDYVSTAFLSWGAQAFTPRGTKEDSEFISPLYHPFRSTVPIWVQAGTAEVLYDDIVLWVKKMRSVGNKIELYESENMPHNLFVVTVEWNLQDEGQQANLAARNFLDRV